MNERRAARLAVLDKANRILLFKVDDMEIFVDPVRPHDRPYWILPGGGLEDGETYEEAALRELREETGIEAPLGPCVGTQDKVLLIRHVPTRCLEQFYVVRVDRPEVDTGGLFGVERDVFRGYQWWAADEMLSSVELFMPPGLAVLASLLATGTIPPVPLALGD